MIVMNHKGKSYTIIEKEDLCEKNMDIFIDYDKIDKSTDTILYIKKGEVTILKGDRKAEYKEIKTLYERNKKLSNLESF
jgi:hypothetical protein